MKNAYCWQQNARWIAWMLLLSGALLVGVGCDSGANPALEQVQFPESGGELVLTADKLASGGAMKVTLEIAPPDDIVSPDNSVGGTLSSKAEADIHFEAHVRYTGALLGGRNKDDFVPYLNIELELTNRDSGNQSKKWTLVPHVGIAEGFHYARNIALVETLGASEAGYDGKVTIQSPTLFGDPDASSISPGIVMHSDLASTHNLAGTLLGPDPVVISAGFILGDFKTVVSKVVGEDGVSVPVASEPPGGGYAY